MKRQRNHLRVIKDVPLDRQRIADLERHLSIVVEHASAYDLIQDRLEQLESEETTLNEVMDQRSGNNELLEAYESLVEATAAWSTGNHIQDQLKDLQKVDDLNGKYDRQAYEKVVGDFQSFHQEIKKLAPYPQLSELKDDLEPMVHDLSRRINKSLVITIDTDTASSHHSDEPVEPARSYHSKLKLQLPTFSGDLLQWKDFWDLFGAVIESERLTDREKICHIQSAMKSEDAKTVVRHAAAGGSYDDIVSALKTRYDKSRVVYMHHVSAFTSRAPIRSETRLDSSLRPPLSC